MLDRKEPRKVFGKGPCSFQIFFFSFSLFHQTFEVIWKKIQSFVVTPNYEKIKWKSS